MERQTQIAVTKKMLLNGWCTLYFLRDLTNSSDAGISARVRDLRKPQFGGYNVIKRKAGAHSYQYRILEA